MLARIGKYYALLLTLVVYGHRVWKPNRSRTLMLFSEKKTTWNHANEICAENGMSMITINSEDVYTAMTLFRHDEWSSYWDHFWTGLHYTRDENSGGTEYVWSSCEPLGGYRPWLGVQTPTTELCVKGESNLKSNEYWETKECGKKDGVPLCEKMTGSCTFRKMEGKSIDTNTLTSEIVIGHRTYNSCLSECVRYKANSECWAFTVKSGVCTIYESQSFTEIIDALKDDTKSTLYTKICFKGLTNSTVYKPKYEDEDEPFKGCPSVHERSHSTLMTRTATAEVDTVSFDVTTTNDYQTKIRDTSSDKSDYQSITGVTPPIKSLENVTLEKLADPTVVMGNTATTDALAHATWGIPINETTNTLDLGLGGNYSGGSTVSQLSNTGDSGTRDTGTSDSMGRVSALNTTERTAESDDAERTDRTKDSGAEDSTGLDSGTGKTETGSGSEGQVTETCRCVCSESTLNAEQRQTLMDEIIESLTINKKHVSANIRRYVSADDNRPFAVAAGGVGLAVLTIVFGGVFLLDVGFLTRGVKNILRLC